MGFFTGGARSMSFGNMGDPTWNNRWRGGVITDISDEKPQTDWKKGTIVTGKDGVTPKTQIIVTLRCDGQGPQALAMGMPAGLTDERTDPTDDGRRSLFVKGNLRYDIGNKLREMEIEEPMIGGELYVKVIGTRQTPNGPGRTYEVLYFPPPAGAQTAGFFNQPEQQAAPPQAQPGNAYGFGHQPAGSPGQQAYAAAGFPAQQSAPMPGFQQAQQPAPATAQAAPPADPWGAPSAPQQPAQPPQGGTMFGAAPAPQAGPPAQAVPHSNNNTVINPFA